jgi:hypothetical protein
MVQPPANSSQEWSSNRLPRGASAAKAAGNRHPKNPGEKKRHSFHNVLAFVYGPCLGINTPTVISAPVGIKCEGAETFNVQHSTLNVEGPNRSR